MNRFFTLLSSNYRIKIEGQLLQPTFSNSRQSWKEKLRESLKQVEHPVFIQREIEQYLHRVDIWLDAKYGKDNDNAVIGRAEAEEILVQALADPDCPWNVVRELEKEWRKLANEVNALNRKYDQAVEASAALARRRMYVDLLLILGNIAFIWGGTYVVYSWDIIEPWAYFISSGAGIYLFRKASLFRKPFSLDNYRNYLIYEVYLERGAISVGLDLNELKAKQKELKVVESTFKDYLITKI
jgi:hypothetical protein